METLSADFKVSLQMCWICFPVACFWCS